MRRNTWYLAQARRTNENGTDVRKLLDAANFASQAARNAWLGYLFILAYLTITLAGVTHKDLLLNTPTTLPFVNVDVPLTGFFLFAPSVLLFLLFGLLLQHQMLYYKLVSLKSELPPETTTPGGTDIRDELHSYFFTQAVVGRQHEREPLLLAYRTMLFATFIAAPLLLLFYFQVRFLPYHSEAITWWHRFHVIGGAAVLLWLGRDLKDMDDTLQGCLRKDRKNDSPGWLESWSEWLISLVLSCITGLHRYFRWALNGLHSILSSSRPSLQSFAKTLYKALANTAWGMRQLGRVVCGVLIWSIFTASVPDGAVDKMMSAIAIASSKQWLSLDCYENYGSEERRVFFLTAFLHEPPRNMNDRCGLQSWIANSRNLILSDQDITKDGEYSQTNYTKRI